VRALRGAGPDSAELYATEGGPEWACVWRVKPPVAPARREALTPPIPIDDAVFGELDQVARGFVAEWIWLASSPQEEIAIERERYASSGLEVAEANVRLARLHPLRAEVGEGKPLVHSTLGAEDLWVKELVLATWASEN